MSTFRSKIFNNVFFNSLRSIRRLINRRLKRKSISVLFFTLFGSLLDFLGLAAIIPVISIISDPTIIHSNRILQSLFTTLGFDSNKTFMVFMLICLITFFIFKSLFGIYLNYKQSRFVYAVATDISFKQFIKYFKYDYLESKETRSTILAHNIANVPTLFASFIMLPTISFISEITITAIILISIALYNFSIFLILVISLFPAVMIIYQGVKKKIQKYEEQNNKIQPEIIQSVLQGVEGYIDIIIYDKIKDFVKVFLLKQKESFNYRSLSYTYGQSPTKLIELAAVFTVVLLLGNYVLFDRGGSNLIETIGVFVAAAYRLMPSSNRIMTALMNLKSYSFTYEILMRIDSSIDQDSYFEEVSNCNKMPFDNKLKIENISFSYDSKNNMTLDKLNIEIEKGETVGIIGESGAGKTTLINIINTLLKQNKGRILVDGTEVNKKSYAKFRKLIGYVKQEVFIFDGTIAENIALSYNREEIDERRIYEAIKLAKLESFVSSKSLGIHTEIGEDGNKISGGQRQRIAIARALYKEAEILIFDEATNALDLETESEIIDSLVSLKVKQITSIIVAHRLSALRHCDRIIEIKNGSVYNEYDYNKLVEMKSNGA